MLLHYKGEEAHKYSLVKHLCTKETINLVVWFYCIFQNLNTCACIYTHNKEGVEMGEDVSVDEENCSLEL